MNSNLLVCQALEASGIPALRAHRGPKDPLILLGGPLTFPIRATAPFVDAILLGEAEEQLFLLSRLPSTRIVLIG